MRPVCAAFTTRCQKLPKRMVDHVINLVYFPSVIARIGCDNIYISWSESETRWQVTFGLTHSAACLAYCKDSKDNLRDSRASWHMHDGVADFHESSTFQIYSPDC